MTAHVLRDYQRDGLARILQAWRDGARSVLAISPVGSGKTTLFGTLAAQLKTPVLINVHRRELATQAANRLREFGVDFGYIMAGEPRKPYARVQIASVQTLVRRQAPPASLVINDEAHLSTADTWRKILEQYPNARILGVTATPWRLSGKPLAGAYNASIVVATPSQLREQGHLSPYVGFSYKAPDLSKVKTTGGDYNEQQSSAAMREPTIVANVVEQWLAHASELSTVVFAVTVEHSRELTAQFIARGVRAEHLDGSTAPEQRRAILRRVERGETRVLVNVGIAVEGLDIPRLKCCVLARPTKSLARFIQMTGRVRRPWNGQTARIHDHSFNIKIHGLPDADRDYTLNARPELPPDLRRCSKCLATYDPREHPRCPACDAENEPKPQGEREIVAIDDAEKFEFSSGESAAPPPVKRPPVDVRWDSPGRVVEGVYQRSFTDHTQYGPISRYVLNGAKRDYVITGTMVLNAKMRAVAPGERVRVTYIGETLIGGGRSRKEFRLEVDHATD